MKVLIDTNIILDVLCNRKDFVEDSTKILKYSEIGKIDGYISALSFPNIVYIMRKELNPKKTQEIINYLCLILNVLDLKAEDVKRATKENFDDYEDALQSICASRIKAQYIVTRNIKDYKNSKVTAIKPDDLIKIL